MAEKRKFIGLSQFKAPFTYELSGKQLMKIFRSTNFYDMGSLRYLYKYLEKSGAMDRLYEMGLTEGDTIRIENFEFEFQFG